MTSEDQFPEHRANPAYSIGEKLLADPNKTVVRKTTELEDIVGDYLVASQLIDEIESHSVLFLRNDDMKILADPERALRQVIEEIDGEAALTNKTILSEITLDTIARRRDYDGPHQFISARDRDRASEIRKTIKKNYILPLGENLRKKIEESSSHVTVGQARQRISSAFNAAQVNNRLVFEAAGSYTDTTVQRARLEELDNLFYGMRSELAIKELILEYNFDESTAVFDIIEATPDDELNGVDLFLDTKVMYDSRGWWRYPTPDEIQQNKCQTIRVPVDVKATQKAVDETMEERRQSGYANKKGNSLVLWSQFHNEDFRLYLPDGKDSQPILKPNELDAEVFLNYDTSLAALRKIDGNTNIRYIRSGQKIKPPSLSKRYGNIQEQILEYIKVNHIPPRRLGKSAIAAMIKAWQVDA
jgi:hypothetical protein